MVRRFLLASLLLVFARYASALQAQPVATDALGDPLPTAARLRLGTLRFRHPSSVVDLALSKDEKTVVSVGDETFGSDSTRHSGGQRLGGEIVGQRSE